MSSLTDSLKTRYDAVFQSDTDSLFYQNLHHYFDLVEKTPELHALIEASQKEYAEKHGAIWGREKCKTDDEADDKAERTSRLERFNLYARSAMIYVRVYLPIEDYKNNDEPEHEQDPVAVLMLRGINRVSPRFAKTNPFKWGRDKLKLYNRWFDGKRGEYEKELRQFHLLLLDAMEKQTDVPVSKEATFDAEQSVLKIGSSPVRITLKNDKTNAHYVLEYIFRHGKANVADYTDILREQFPNERMDWRGVYRACKDIENKVREQANIDDFLTTTTGKTGWVKINPLYAESAGKTA